MKLRTKSFSRFSVSNYKTRNRERWENRPRYQLLQLIRHLSGLRTFPSSSSAFRLPQSGITNIQVEKSPKIIRKRLDSGQKCTGMCLHMVCAPQTLNFSLKQFSVHDAAALHSFNDVKLRWRADTHQNTEDKMTLVLPWQQPTPKLKWPT